MTIIFQPGPVVDHITADGTELTMLPYPIFSDPFGSISGQTHARIVGFVADPARQQVDLLWGDMTDLQQAVGMYVITLIDGQLSTNVIAIQSVREVDIDE